MKNPIIFENGHGWVWFDEYGWVNDDDDAALPDEEKMLNEIDRLRGIARSAHGLDDITDFDPQMPYAHTWWCNCGDSGHGRNPLALHVAHVEAILNGD